MSRTPTLQLQPALRKGRVILLALGLAACAGVSTLSAAPIVANFTDGDGTGVDGYVGSPGGGWATAWVKARNTENASDLITITDSDPFPDGGNRLSVSLTSTHSNSRGVVVSRAYDGISLSQPQTISFDVRIDTRPAQTRRFYFFDSSLSATLSGEASTTTWLIRVNASGAILLYNGTDSSTVPGMSIAEDTPYRFTINVSPATTDTASSYTVRIENLASPSEFYQSGPLAFYGGQSTLGGNLNFYGAMDAVPSSTTLAYSLDNISVIPESSTAALASAGLVSLGLLRFLRHRRLETVR